MNERPRIKPILTTADKIIEAIGYITIIGIWVLTLTSYNKLPVKIPIHFNGAGEADRLGDAENIFILPVISTVIFVGLSILNRFPHIFNYPAKVTSENAEKLYMLGTRTIRILKLIVVLSFAFLNYRTIEIAMNRATELGKLFLPTFLSVLAISTATMVYKMIKAKI